jgi:hypothetical protein
MILIFDNKGKAQSYAQMIHIWLMKNRKGYKAEKWCDIDESKSDIANEWCVKIPDDYEVLNKGIAKAEDRLTISKGAIRQLNKLPDNWRTNTWDG